MSDKRMTDDELAVYTRRVALRLVRNIVRNEAGEMSLDELEADNAALVEQLRVDFPYSQTGVFLGAMAAAHLECTLDAIRLCTNGDAKLALDVVRIFDEAGWPEQAVAA